jgi:septal ring factor EnvC (AmiA/AmiB activator)
MNNQRSGREIARHLARTVSEPLAARFWPKIEEIAANHARQASERADRELAALRAQLTERQDGAARDIDRAHGRIDEVAGWHAALGAEFDKLRDRVGKLEHELSRVAAQLSALDTRVARDERPPVAVPGGKQAAGELATATKLVDEIRAEHQRVRARLTAVASYEERIGRLEEHLS